MVYVDNYRAPFGRMIMCHMTADTWHELFAMARELKLKPEWFQAGIFPHFDISTSKRYKAIGLGAQQVRARDIVQISKRLGQGKLWEWCPYCRCVHEQLPKGVSHGK